MQTGIRLQAEPVRHVTSLAIHNAAPGVWLSIDVTEPTLLHPARIILFQNFTNADLMISMDGIHSHFPIPAGGFLLLDVTSNRSDLGGGYYIAEGTRFYVMRLGADPTLGNLWMSVFYAAE